MYKINEDISNINNLILIARNNIIKDEKLELIYFENIKKREIQIYKNLKKKYYINNIYKKKYSYVYYPFYLKYSNSE